MRRAPRPRLVGDAGGRGDPPRGYQPPHQAAQADEEDDENVQEKRRYATNAFHAVDELGKRRTTGLAARHLAIRRSSKPDMQHLLRHAPLEVRLYSFASPGLYLLHPDSESLRPASELSSLETKANK